MSTFFQAEMGKYTLSGGFNGKQVTINGGFDGTIEYNRIGDSDNPWTENPGRTALQPGNTCSFFGFSQNIDLISENRTSQCNIP